MTQTFDVLIVGGGSAGAVLANRLSEDGTRRIILLEAGSAYSPNLYPPDLANADIVGGPDGHDWGYVGATGIGDRSIRALRGKALGGSSAVNAAVAIRARAADFAKWSALGIQGWSKVSFSTNVPMTRLTGNQSMETDSVGEQEGLGRSCAGTGRPVLLSYSSTSTRCLYGTVRKASGSGWRLAFLASEVCGCSEHLAHYRIWAFTWVSPVHLYAGPPCDVVGAPLLATCVTIPGEDVHITMPGEGRQAVQGATVSLCRLAMAPPGVRTPAQRLLSYGGASSWKRY